MHRCNTTLSSTGDARVTRKYGHWRECQQECVRKKTCSVWTWSPSKQCLFRRGTNYAPAIAKGFVSGHVSSDAVLRAWRRDAEKFRRYMRSIQNPRVCEPAGMRGWKGWPHGLGSTLHVMRNYFLLSMHKGYAFDPSGGKSPYVSRNRCRSGSALCWFESPTNCSGLNRNGSLRSDSHTLAHPAYGPECPAFDPAVFQKAANLSRGYPIAFYASLLMQHLTRPNPELTRFTEMLRAEINFKPGRTLGVHIRLGDKCNGRNGDNVKCIPVQAYANAIRCLARAKGYQRVFLGSDNLTTFATLSKLLKGHVNHVVQIPSGYFQEDPQFYSKPKLRANQQNGGSAWDEGMVLLAQIRFFAECDGFLGTLSSNLGRLVYELAVVKSSGDPIEFYDMDGNPYMICSCTHGHPPFGDAWFDLRGKQRRVGFGCHPDTRAFVSSCGAFRPVSRNVGCGVDPVQQELQSTRAWCEDAENPNHKEFGALTGQFGSLPCFKSRQRNMTAYERR